MEDAEKAMARTPHPNIIADLLGEVRQTGPTILLCPPYCPKLGFQTPVQGNER